MGASASAATWSVGRAAGRIAVLLLSCCVVGGCRELPEAASPDAALYVAKCGAGCHIVHHPHTLTAAMWKVQVARMDAKYRAAGIAAPSGEERERILAYLTRHAGG